MTHYFPNEKRSELQAIAAANAFTGPSFVGQGLTRSVGSDSYGYFIVSIEKAKNGKPIVGIVSAEQTMIGSWEEGDEDCKLPNGAVDPAAVQATTWITISGKWKRTGEPKWWYCDKNGKKFNGQHAHFRWNGARGYRDPCF